MNPVPIQNRTNNYNILKMTKKPKRVKSNKHNFMFRKAK